ncbi:MAG: hypothetical protein MUE60_12295 [Candidatus Eisenbacteria bacterium]|jgi:hypothetical protein|nr:hypothetical protein [Candidatus Eisenbacteria bacterium]
MEWMTPAEAAQELDGAPFLWWITGGWALSLYSETQWREHHDVDVAVFCRDLVGSVTWLGQRLELQETLDGWIPGGSGRACISRSTKKRVEVFLSPATDDGWVYRRDPSICIPWKRALVSRVGIPVLAPELVLLSKGRSLRGIDWHDARETVPRLTPEAKDWLFTTLPTGHPWSRFA